MSDWNDLVRLSRAKLSTAILRYPSGRYGLCGAIPYELTKPYTSGYTTGRTSMVWETEQEVIAALLAIGVTRFQRADCSWYEEEVRND